MPIRSTNGSRPGRGGSAIADWLDLQAPGTQGERRPVYVDGEICVARFTGTTWSLATPSAPAQAYAAVNLMPPGATPTAPTTPTTSRLVTLGQGIIGATFGATQGYNVRIVNTSSETITHVEVEYLCAGDADILALWIGSQANPGGASGLDVVRPDGGTSSFQRATFGGSNSVTVEAGTYESPRAYWSDALELAVPVPPGGAIVLRWVFSAGTISTCRAAGAAYWPSGQVLSDYRANGDIGSSPEFLDVDPGWNGSQVVPLHGLRLTYGGASGPTVNLIGFGDSIMEQERSGGDLSREGFIYQAGAVPPRINSVSAGQGQASLDLAHQRLTNQLPSLVGRADIVLFQAVSHNQRPSSVAGIDAWLARIASIKGEVEGAGLGFAPIVPTGPADSYSADEIAAWNAVRDALASAYPATFIDIASVVMTGSVNNSAHFADKIHPIGSGQTLLAAAYRARIATVAANLGYTA